MTMSTRIVGLAHRFDREGLGAKILGRETERRKALGINTIADFLQHLMQYDPDKRKSNLRWLAECYARDGYLLEDLSKARETLELYSKHRNSLAPEHRDILRFSKLADLWNVVAPYNRTEPVLTSRAKERLLKARVYEETTVLWEDDEFRMVIPQTVLASRWWGRGTQWCTAMSKGEGEESFKMYNRHAPLVIIQRRSDGRKAQAYASCLGSLEIMDENDRPIERGARDSKDGFEDWVLDTLHPFMKVLAKYGYIPVSQLMSEPWTAEDRANALAMRGGEDIWRLNDEEITVELAMHIARSTPHAQLGWSFMDCMD
jgi:hypothetical protein